jgi:HK97 family phage prohead protease
MEQFELRSNFAADSLLGGDGNTVVGYAVVYDKASEPLSFPKLAREPFREVIRRGAATEALRSARDVAALYAHDAKQLLGRTSSGTLVLTEDDKGLRYSIKLPDTTLGRDVKEMIKRGDIRGASFYIDVAKDEWKRSADGLVREVHALRSLREVTLTPFPAYPDTTAALRSYEQWEHDEQSKLIVPLSVREHQVRLAKIKS